MGTLKDQSVKTSGSLREAVDYVVGELDRLIRPPYRYSADTALAVLQVAQKERELDLEATRQNSVDEQIAGTAELAEGVINTIERHLEWIRSEGE